MPGLRPTRRPASTRTFFACVHYRMRSRTGLRARRLDRLGVCMEAARQIRSAVAQVALLRQAVAALPGLGTAVAEVKRLQSRRFAGTYADLLARGPYAAPARFFLEELYSDK